MDFDTIKSILGAEAVTEMEQVTESIYATHGNSTIGRGALTELLVAMLAAVNAREHATGSDAEFRKNLEALVDRLRSVCVASRTINGSSDRTH